MYNLAEIENMNLSKMDRKEVVEIRDHLIEAFYHTKTTEGYKDSRLLKDVIGAQMKRFSKFLWNN